MSIKENIENSQCLIQVKISDPDYIHKDVNKDDPNIHTISYITFYADKNDIKNRVKEEVYKEWLKYTSLTIKKVRNKVFIIDDETGECDF